jgi:cytochrome b6-f complex iron-sulfur subunit
MADKKKLSVAEILAAARKADAKEGGESPAKPAAAPSESAEPAAAAAPAEPAAVPTDKPPAKPTAAPGQRPSVAEMLAMARAGDKGRADAPAAKPAPKAPAAEEKPSSKPVAKPAAKPAKAEAAPPGGPKDTASILAAARKSARPGPVSKESLATRGATAVAAPVREPVKKEKAAAVAPPMPAKPDYVKKPAKPAKGAAPEEDRRFVLGVMLGSFLGIGFTALTGTLGLWTLGFARFMFPNILTEPPSRFKVGPPDAYPPGYVEDKFKAQFGVWVVNAEYKGQQQIFALRTVCTHLGCTPNWLEAEQKFKCPCHGSGFYKDGINFEGPAPRPLERYAIRIADDGQLEIDKGRMFQEELGAWADAASFVPV